MRTLKRALWIILLIVAVLGGAVLGWYLDPEIREFLTPRIYRN